MVVVNEYLVPSPLRFVQRRDCRCRIEEGGSELGTESIPIEQIFSAAAGAWNNRHDDALLQNRVMNHSYGLCVVLCIVVSRCPWEYGKWTRVQNLGLSVLVAPGEQRRLAQIWRQGQVSCTAYCRCQSSASTSIYPPC